MQRRACKNWATAPCTVISSTLRKKTTNKGQKSKSTSYYVVQNATVRPNGTSPYITVVYKSSDTARKKSHRGESFDSTADARHYMNKFAVDETFYCYYNPNDAYQVAFRCRNVAMIERFKAWRTVFIVASIPAALLICGLLVAYVKGKCWGSSRRPTTKRTRPQPPAPARPAARAAAPTLFPNNTVTNTQARFPTINTRIELSPQAASTNGTAMNTQVRFPTINTRIELSRQSSFPDFPWISSRAAAELRSAFDEIDFDGNGTLSRDEVVNVASRGTSTQATVRKFLGLHDEEVLSSDYWDQVFTSMDTNHDNMVSFEEFVMHLWPPPIGDGVVTGSAVTSGAGNDAVVTAEVIAPGGSIGNPLYP